MAVYRILQMGDEFKVQTVKNDTEEWRDAYFHDDGTYAQCSPLDMRTICRFDSEEGAKAAADVAWGKSGTRVQEWRVI